MTIARKLTLYVVYFGLVVALALAIGLAFRSHKSTNITAKPSGGSSTVTKTPGKAIANSGSTTKVGTQQSNAVGSASNTTSTTTPTTLTNTGPGNVITLFVVVSFFATLVHWRWRVNRLY
jgi:hypothetical protein